MTATDKVFAGSVPEIYDRLLVPLIFEPYATDLAGRIAAGKPHDVLETAAGTGVLTCALAERLSPDVRITATDLNQPMLDKATARQSDPRRVTWRQADALALPFPDRSFDVVACQFGVMFFPDKVQGYREARRVLRPDGHFGSPCGTRSQRASSPTWSPRRWRPCFRKTRHVSWRARHTAIATRT